MKTRLLSLTLVVLAACSKPAPTPEPKTPVAPTITCNIEEGASDVAPGTTPIILTASEAIDPASVSATNITLSAGGLVYPLTFAVSTDGLTITLTPEGLDEHKHYTLFVSGLQATADLGALKMKSNLQVHFATVGGAPTLTATTPQDGTNGVSVSATPTLTFSEAVVDSNPTAIQLLHGTDVVDADVSFDTHGKVATITPVGELFGNATYKVVVGPGLKDADDQLSMAGAPVTVLTFTTESIPPVVRDVTPHDSTTIPVDAQFTIIFSRRMNPATINTSTITLTDAAQTPVAISVSLDSELQQTATVTHAAPLMLGVSYLLVVSTGVKDYSDIPLVESYTYHYSTPPPQPAVASIVPADNAMDAPINSNVVVTFNVPMNISTITSDHFKVTDTTTGDVLTGLVTAPLTGYSATFIPSGVPNYPSGEYKPLTDYTVTLTADIRDARGIALTAFTSHFKTEQEPAPTVLSVMCQGMPDTTMCQTQTEIVVQFSRPVQNVTASTFYMTAQGSSTPLAITPNVANPYSASLLPGMALDAGTYTVTLTSGITNNAGLPLAPFTWEFTAVAGM